MDKQVRSAPHEESMALQETLQQDLRDAMRSGDTARRDVIRFLRARIHDQEIARQGALDDDGVIEVLSRQAKQNQESIDAFKKGDRPDLVAKEEAELGIIREYLPAQLSEDEIAQIARAAIDEIGAAGPQEMGKVMGRVMPRVRGKADGRAVSRIVQELLRSAG